MSTRIVRVDLGGRSYPIRIGRQLLTSDHGWPDLAGRQLRLISDSNVAPLYADSVLRRLGLTADDALVVPAGEPSKSWAQAERVLDWLLTQRLSRDAVLIALGGGMVGDLVGFCAAIYQRGIDFIQLPTSLLAQVDSSVGGKTGINHPAGKNLIGAFHQPIAVIADSDTLNTLPRRELASGLAEVIKYGMLADVLLFEWLESNLPRLLALEPSAIAEAVERCCGIKARIVGSDERESTAGGARALLNLGHTFGHAIETHTAYLGYLHGEAVAIGLCMAADLSMRHGWIDANTAKRCVDLIQRAGLPIRPPASMSSQHFQELMKLDKKVKSGVLRLVLLRRLGEAMLSNDYDESLLATTLAVHTQTPTLSPSSP